MSLSYSNALIVANGKKPHTALVLIDNEVIDSVAAYMKKAAHGDLYYLYFMTNYLPTKWSHLTQKQFHYQLFRN